jgi:hypothetical protein
MTGRVIVADAEFIKAPGLSELLLEQEIAWFADKHELGWSVRIFGEIALLHLVAPDRMGYVNLKTLFLELLVKIAAMNSSPVRFTQRVGA